MPLNFTLGQQLRGQTGDMMPTGVLPATVDSIFGDRVAVRISSTGRRISNVPVVGNSSRLVTGDTVYLMETAPNQYIVMSPKQQYGTGSPVATDHTHSDFLTLEEVQQLLAGYAPVSHTHPSPSLANLLQKPDPAMVTPVASTSYVGTTGYPGAYVDHQHDLPIDSSLQWTSGSLGSGGISPSAGVGHEHAIARWSGSPSEFSFSLPDYADEIMSMSIGGLEVDPIEIGLSSDGGVITLSTALAAGATVQASYILRSL